MLYKKGLGGNDSEDGDTKDKDDEAERERLEAIKEAEDRRKEKHRKMEAERENMRQDIRDKVINTKFIHNNQWSLYSLY
jgi:complexin-1/2